MKRIQAIALLTIATLSATVGARAQQRAVIANIPFNFTVAGSGAGKVAAFAASLP